MLAAGCSASHSGNCSAVVHTLVRRVARFAPESACNRSAQPVLASTSAAVTKPSKVSASCISSALRTCGHASSRTAAIASGSSRPRSSASSAFQRRFCTAWVRRSSSGASSRKAYGAAFSTSAASGLGPVRSRAAMAMSPLSIERRIASRPSTSIASRRQSCMVWLTSG
jgi:hypothetical protein